MEKKTLEKLCNTFLYIGPFLDILTAWMIHQFHLSFTIGIFVRFFYCIFLIGYLLTVKEGKKEKKRTLVGIGIFFLYFLIFLWVTCRNQGFEEIFIEAKSCLRSFYFPLLLWTLYKIQKNKKIALSRESFSKIYFLYLLFIFVPNFLGIGFDSYEVTKTGKIGFFNSANEVSAILSILMPFYLTKLYQDHQVWKTVLGVFLLVFVLLTIGTKGPFLSLGVCLFLFLLIGIKKWIQEKAYRKIGICLIGLLFLFTFLPLFLPKTTFYKNIQVHLDFLKVDSIPEVLKDPHLIDHFIFSSRITFWYRTQKIYQSSSFQEKLFGLGYSYKEEESKLIEMDPIDVFYRHGIIGFLLYFGFVWIVLKNIFKEKKGSFSSTEKISFFLILLLSFFTGHILLAPSVSIFVVYLFLSSSKKEVIL